MNSEVKRKIEFDGVRNALLNTIPDGMTNGEVIKALFPYISKYNNMLLKDHSENILFDDSWRNAPYKENKKGVLESIAEEQKTLLDTTKAWSNYIDKNGNIY